MAASTPTNITVERDALGFLLHAEHWSQQIPTSVARDDGINDLTDRHWQVIEPDAPRLRLAREHAVAPHAQQGLRRVD